jgi:hypothetical protein
LSTSPAGTTRPTFKTIGAALRALKPHQAVRVLDRGPYSEFLRSQVLPDDTGLITETGCVIQAPDKSPGGPDDDWDHQLAPLDGFRLHGFHFDRLPGTRRGTLYCGNISGLVIEHCRMTLTDLHDEDDRGGILLGAPCSNANARPNVVRECFFDGQLLGIGQDLENTVVVVERNYFRSRARALAWLAANTQRLDTLLVRHNGTLVDRNVYWDSTTPDAPNWTKTIGNPQATMSSAKARS